MQFVIISGMSGAGKSKAASDLEDLGFYCVDNMPAEMIPQFAQLCLATKGRYEKVALVTDIRASMTFDALFQALQKLDDMHLQYSIYYIEASTAVIIKRYKETRRLHPLMKDGSTLENAIARERELLAPVRNRASAIIDTSNLSTGKLRGQLIDLVAGGMRKHSEVLPEHTGAAAVVRDGHDRGDIPRIGLQAAQHGGQPVSAADGRDARLPAVRLIEPDLFCKIRHSNHLLPISRWLSVAA